MLEVSIESFSYAKEEILSEIEFVLQEGEHLAVLGESGCGKSTLLHLVYGLLQLNKGSIRYKETPLLGPSHNIVPGESFMKLVAQEFNVMPYISVAENIATHLSRLDREKDNERIDELLEVVDLSAFKDTHVQYLSGGQKQRVVLAKALANEPEILLLDEPFSHIDTFRKNILRRKLFGYLKENNITCITSTHDAEEALAFSDQMLMLKQGKSIRLGTPDDIYSSLNSSYELGFFGEITEVPAGILSKESLLLLPHQLKVATSETNLEVTVLNSYFKGNYHLVEAVFDQNSVFFNHFESIPKEKRIFLSLAP